MNQYELAVLYDPGLEIDLSGSEERVKKIIAEHGGDVTASDNWGKRKLAYKIRGHDSAVYVFYTFETKPESIKAIESELNISDEVIRFLITKPDLKKRAKAEAEREAKAKKNAARENSESEESEE